MGSGTSSTLKNKTKKLDFGTYATRLEKYDEAIGRTVQARLLRHAMGGSARGGVDILLMPVHG